MTQLEETLSIVIPIDLVTLNPRYNLSLDISTQNILTYLSTSPTKQA